jgi:hypothetical protein
MATTSSVGSITEMGTSCRDHGIRAKVWFKSLLKIHHLGERVVSPADGWVV